MLRRVSILICWGVFLLISSCTESIEFDFGELRSSLVIDGYLSDSLKSQTIKLSYTTQFAQPITEERAAVAVKDDLGTGYIFNHVGAGVYKSKAFEALEERSYKLIVSIEGELYESDFEALPKIQNHKFDISYEPEERQLLSEQSIITDQEGVRVSTIINRGDEPRYYQWIIEHWLLAIAPRALDTLNNICYARDFAVPRVVLMEDRPGMNQSADSYIEELEFVPLNYKTKDDFCVEVSQLILTEKAFLYWSQIREQVESVGSMFDPAPNNIRGNIYSVNTAKPLIGYFGVYREQSDRVFFNQRELPFRNREYFCPPRTPWCEDCIFFPADHVQRQKPEWWR